MICISDSPLFSLSSTGYVKFVIEFFIQLNSSRKSNYKISFHAVSQFTLKVSTLLIGCMYNLFFARKNIKS